MLLLCGFEFRMFYLFFSEKMFLESSTRSNYKAFEKQNTIITYIRLFVAPLNLEIGLILHDSSIKNQLDDSKKLKGLKGDE